MAALLRNQTRPVPLPSWEKDAARQLERELERARRLQQQFLAAVPTELAGFQLAAEYQPRFEIGGDFYDVLQTGDRQITSIIGDVSGKGIAAALLMSRVSGDFRRVASITSSPGQILERLNKQLATTVPDDTFVTAACIRYDAQAGRLSLANAGHCLPLIRRASGGVVLVGRSVGTPLGMVSPQRYHEQVVSVDSGDIIVLVTDGIIDALDPAQTGRGAWRLTDLVAAAALDLDEIRASILREVSLSPRPSRDDVALLAVQEMKTALAIAG